MPEDLLKVLPDQSAALIFHTDGSVSIAIPKPMDDMNGKDLVSAGSQAATELLLMISDGDLTVDGLAQAFARRVAS